MSLWYCSEHKLCNYQCCEKATTPVIIQDCDVDDKVITYDYLLDWYEEDEEKDLEKLEELLMKYNFGSITIDW